jgi:hypothetical protein
MSATTESAPRSPPCFGRRSLAVAIGGVAASAYAGAAGLALARIRTCGRPASWIPSTSIGVLTVVAGRRWLRPRPGRGT